MTDEDRPAGARITDVGWMAWLREPLDEAVAGAAGRGTILAPPSVATMGTPAHGAKAALLGIARREGAVFQMGEHPGLPRMPERPTLRDFYERRFPDFDRSHMLQSAALAMSKGLDEKVVLACLLHDIAVAGLISSGHGHWGAQLIAPYVDEEVAWAVRRHEALRFYADESVGYTYPDAYREYFGDDYRPPEHVRREYEAARRHRWYLSARLVTLNDAYSFDPAAAVSFDLVEDIVGRHFRQPPEGLGFDDSPVAHMWRTMIWPNNFL